MLIKKIKGENPNKEEVPIDGKLLNEDSEEEEIDDPLPARPYLS